MPVLKIAVMRRRSPGDLRLLLDTIHEVVVSAFDVPARDRYQIVTEYDPTHLIAEDTGLDIARSPDFTIIELVSRPRTQAQKLNFYALLADALKTQCAISPADLMIYFVENGDVDWSFGLGRAQFVTGDLSP